MRNKAVRVPSTLQPLRLEDTAPSSRRGFSSRLRTGEESGCRSTYKNDGNADGDFVCQALGGQGFVMRIIATPTARSRINQKRVPSGELRETLANVVIGDLFDQMLDLRPEQRVVESRPLGRQNAPRVFEIPMACREHLQNDEVLG